MLKASITTTKQLSQLPRMMGKFAADSLPQTEIRGQA